MQPLTVTGITLTPFTIPFVRPFTIAGSPVSERSGLYVAVAFSDGTSTTGEIAPLPGFSIETLKKARHDAEQAQSIFTDWTMVAGQESVLQQLRQEAGLNRLSPSVRFGIESAILEKAGFLDQVPAQVDSAGLLQGNQEQVIAQAKVLVSEGVHVFKLKVGDRNIPLDVKKVQDLRAVIERDDWIRLDANGSWHFNEAVLFAQLAGNAQIEFIEEPLSDMSRLGSFYQSTQMPVALDETLGVMRCGVEAPGRCSPTLARHEAVNAYVIKPMILGGVIAALDWMAEAQTTGKRAIISSSFESAVGMRMLKALAVRSRQVAGLGTEAWVK